jgi:ornithine carbamoyltransferase
MLRRNTNNSQRVLSSSILVTTMKEALSSSGTSVLTRVTWGNIPEDTIHHSHRRENLKSYTVNELVYERRQNREKALHVLHAYEAITEECTGFHLLK